MKQAPSERTPGAEPERRQYFVVGGPLAAERTCYLRRPIDDELLTAVRAGALVNLTGARHMGKTSLLLRTAAALRESGDAEMVALIDLKQLGGREQPEDAGRWFYAIAYRLVRQLRMSLDLQAWWSDRTMMTNRQRFRDLFHEMLIEFPNQRIALLFDDVQTLEDVDFGEQLLGSFRAAFDSRASEPEFGRLSIVMCGTAVNQFILRSDPRLPFSVAKLLTLSDLRQFETNRFAPALGRPRADAELAMQRIYNWVGGHPYLTQKIARAISRGSPDRPAVDAVDEAVARLFLKEMRTRPEAHFRAVEEALVTGRALSMAAMMAVVGQVNKGVRLLAEPDSPIHWRLRRVGLLTVSPDGFLTERNRLYSRVFNAWWANRMTPTSFRGVAKAVALFFVVLALPLWYTQLFPQHFADALLVRDSTVASATADWQRYRRWPLHSDTVDRLYRVRLQQLAREAATPGELATVTDALRRNLDAGALAANLERTFWQAQSALAARAHNRAAALSAAIMALGDGPGNVSVRRRIGSLISDDLPALTAVLRHGAPVSDEAIVAGAGSVVTVTGQRINEWRLGRSPRAARSEPDLSWPLTALRTRPQTVRLTIDDGRLADVLRLRVALVHERRADLTMRVTSPSGRSVVLPLGDAEPAEDVLSFNFARDPRFAPFSREPAAGVWSVSVVDNAPSFEGRLVGVELVAGRRSAVPAEMTSLPLADPEPVEPTGVTITPNGRFAIAMAGGSERLSAVWDIAGRRPIASIPLPAESEFVGFIDNNLALLVKSPGGLAAFRLVTGEPVALPETPANPTRAALAPDGRFLGLVPADALAGVTVVDLRDGTTRVPVAAGALHLGIAVAPEGDRVAVADADAVVRVWQPGLALPVAEIDAGGPVRQMAFDPAGNELYIATEAGPLLIWSREGGRDTRRFADGARWSFAFDVSSDLAMIGSPASGFRLRDPADGLDRSGLLRGLVDAESVRLGLNMRRGLALSTVPEDGTVTVWRPRVAALPTSSARVDRAWLSPDARRIAFTNPRGDFFAFSLDASPEALAAIEADLNAVLHATPPGLVRFSGDGSLVLSAERDGRIRVQDTASGEVYRYIARIGENLRDAAFSAAAPEAFLAAGDSGVRIFDTASGDVRHAWLPDAPINAVHAVPGGWLVGDVEGRLLSIASADGAYRVLPVAELGMRIDRIATGHGDLVVAAGGESLVVVDARTGQPAAPPLAFPDDINALQVSDNGRWAVVRSGQWLHRVHVSHLGAAIESSLVVPTAMMQHEGIAIADPSATVVTLLDGIDEPVPMSIAFDARFARPAAGSRDELLARWGALLWQPVSAEPPSPAVE